MAKRPIRPGSNQEALFEQAPLVAPDTHLFDRLAQDAAGQQRMDEARAAASAQEHTPLGIVLDVSAELRRRELAYAADRYDQDVAEQARWAEMGSVSAPIVLAETPEQWHERHYGRPKRVSYPENPGPVVGDDPTPIDGLARQEPVYPTHLDASIASRYLPRLQWNAHEHAIDLRDQTPTVGIINEGDPIPEFPQPEMPYTGQISARDDKLHWYDQR